MQHFYIQAERQATVTAHFMVEAIDTDAAMKLVHSGKVQPTGQSIKSITDWDNRIIGVYALTAIH